ALSTPGTAERCIKERAGAIAPDPGGFLLAPGFRARECAPSTECFFISRLASARHHPHPTLPPSRGRASEEDPDRRRSPYAHAVFIECRAKALPLDGGGLGGGDAAQLTAIAEWTPRDAADA